MTAARKPERPGPGTGTAAGTGTKPKKSRVPKRPGKRAVPRDRRGRRGGLPEEEPHRPEPPDAFAFPEPAPAGGNRGASDNRNGIRNRRDSAPTLPPIDSPPGNPPRERRATPGKTYPRAIRAKKNPEGARHPAGVFLFRRPKSPTPPPPPPPPIAARGLTPGIAGEARRPPFRDGGFSVPNPALPLWEPRNRRGFRGRKPETPETPETPEQRALSLWGPFSRRDISVSA
jgi:hypothetical protein